MTSKTPRTDAQAYNVLYRADMGGWFRADEIKKDPYGDHISADFARQLEEENLKLRELVGEAYSVLTTISERNTPYIQSWHAVDMANVITKLQPFLQ